LHRCAGKRQARRSRSSQKFIMLKFPSRQINYLKFICIALTVTVYFLRLDSNVGLMVDDSWYVLLAKSISEGHGYHLINSTAPQTTPLYPPGFPAILSLIWSLNSNFPANVIAMKFVSLAALALTWKLLLHLHRQYFQASEVMCWLMTTTVMLTPLLVHYATSTLMSECVFLFLQTLLIVLCFQVESSKHRWILIFVIGFIAGFSVMIRIAGVALVLAAVLTFLLRKKFAAALLIFFLGFLPLGVWIISSFQSSPPAPEERSNYLANNYFFHFLRSDENNPRSPDVTVSKFVQRISHNAIELSSSSFGQLFFPLLNPKRSYAGIILSYLITLILLTGMILTIRSKLEFIEIYFIISMIFILGWAFSPTRFLVVLMPILLQYFWIGIGFLFRVSSPRVSKGCNGKSFIDSEGHIVEAALADARATDTVRAVSISILLAGFVAIQLAMIAAKYDFRLKNNFVMFQQQQNLEEIVQWTKQNIPADQIIATDIPALIFLHTNHRTVHLIDAENDQELWRKLGIHFVVMSGITTGKISSGVELRFTTKDQKAAIYEVK
jgi:hypothetical protein